MWTEKYESRARELDFSVPIFLSLVSNKERDEEQL